MESEWTYTSIDELKADSKGSIAIGPFGSRMKSDCYVESGIPVIRGTNITGGPDFEGEFVYITEEKADTLGSSNVYQGDLVFPHRGAIGEVGILQEDKRFVLSSSLMKLTCDEQKAYPKFLYYFFKSHLGKHELLKNASQVGTPGIGQPLTSLKAIELSIPPLPEQKAIAHILGTLDDKIELNRKMNATLEAMAQALFKSWFVDFDPVIDNALAAGKPIPEALAVRAEIRRQALADGTANREAAKAFPDSFQETEELGWIPEGWEEQALYDMAKFVNGAAYKGADFSDSPDALPVIKIAEIKAGITAQTKFTEINKGDKYKIYDGDILLSWSGNPDTSIDTFIWTDGAGYLNQHIFNVCLHEESERYFVYYQLKYLRSTFAEIARDKQTTGLGHFTAGDMKRLKVFKPEVQLLKHFNSAVSSLYHRSYENRLSTKTLTKLRDTLLPKLISGELRITAAEQLTEKALA